MTDPLQPQIAPLLAAYARDLARIKPSMDLDARINALVAAHPREHAHPAPQRAAAVLRWAAAASVAALSIAAGVVIGIRLERSGATPVAATSGHEPSWPPPDFAMWPTDSVELKIPAEFSARGTLVAVDGNSQSAGARYWVNIIVSNDGTIRIENVVPAGDSHGPSLQTP